MILQTADLTLRPWGTDDIDALAAIANDRRIWANLRDRFPHPYTRENAAAWVAVCAAREGPIASFAIEVDGELAGAVGLDRFEDIHRVGAELGYWLGARYWGRGLATAAVNVITRYSFETLGLERIQAGVLPWNLASARVLEKAGYALEARLRRAIVKDGRIDDELLYARVRSDGAVSASGRSAA